MKLFELEQPIKVGLYYRVEEPSWPLPPTIVRVTYIGFDHPEPNETGTVAQFEYFENDEKKELEWYLDNFEERSRPATKEEITTFLQDERRAGRKFLDNLKDDKE